MKLLRASISCTKNTGGFLLADRLYVSVSSHKAQAQVCTTKVADIVFKETNEWVRLWTSHAIVGGTFQELK